MDQPISVRNPSVSQSPADARPRAPLIGVVSLVLAVGGFAGWSGIRITEATKAKKQVAAQRDEDAKRAAAAAKMVPGVAVVKPVPTTWAPVVEVDGTIAAGQSASLGFKTGGRIAELSVKAGDSVKAGQLLASLDSREASAQLKSAQARKRAAEAQLALAADSEKRTQTMVQSGSLPEAMGVQTSQQHALAVAQLDSAQADIGLVSVTLSNHRLTAPFAGSVVKAPDGVGAVVAPGEDLFEVVDLSSLRLRGTVSENDAGLLDVGDEIAISTERGAVAGKLTAVLGSVDPSTRRVRVEAAITNHDSRLRAGSFVRAEVRGKKSVSVLSLPREVLRPGGQGEVLVVNGDTLASRHIDYSVSKSGELLVRHGLEPDAQVVLSPKSDAKPGDKVAITPASAPAPKPAPAASR